MEEMGYIKQNYRKERGENTWFVVCKQERNTWGHKSKLTLLNKNLPKYTKLKGFGDLN
jgi:hypothetical protein